MSSKVKSSEKGDEKVESLIKNVPEESKEPAKNVSSLEEMLFDLKAEIEKLKAEKEVKQQISEEEYDILEDYLEVPAVFFSFSSEYAIFGDKRNGKESLPPNREFVKFKKLYRYNRKGAGRAVEVVAVSQATIRSKALADWIRKHSLFGIKFFENINDVKSVDVVFADKMAEAAARVSSMSDMQVIERMKSENQRVHTDVELLRKELIQLIANQSIKRSKALKEREFKAERDEHGRKVEYRNGEQSVSGEVY